MTNDFAEVLSAGQRCEVSKTVQAKDNQNDSDAFELRYGPSRQITALNFFYAAALNELKSSAVDDACLLSKRHLERDGLNPCNLLRTALGSAATRFLLGLRCQNQCALRLSVRTTAFHVVKTGSTPVGRTNFLDIIPVRRFFVVMLKHKAKAQRQSTFGALVAVVLIIAATSPKAWSETNLQPGIAAFPNINKTKSGRSGDLINVGLVGTRVEIVAAMKAAGWFPADPVTAKTSLKITGSVLFRKAYNAAPVSALFYQGRIQDLAFEKPVGKSAAHRHHVRFWQVLDQGAEGRPVWLGSATFDKSVGLSHTTHKFTHHIAADVDAERETLLADLTHAKILLSTYLLMRTGPIEDARNGGGDHYFSDGMIHFAVIAEGAIQQTNPPLNVSGIK